MSSALEVSSPDALTGADIGTCLDILREGKAVDIEAAAKELPQAVIVALSRNAGKIVAIGAIKRRRPGYAASVSAKSKCAFDSNIHELGYVAVRESEKGKRLSHVIVAALLANCSERPLFATTYDFRMKKTLGAAGFVNRGGEWQGTKETLSLWILEAKTNAG